MTDWNAELFARLYSKMSLALGVTPTPDQVGTDLARLMGPVRPEAQPGARQEQDFLLAIYNPGQYVPATLDPENNVNDRYSLSVLLDVVPQFSWVFKPAASTVTNTYRSVLDYKETPLTSLTPEQKAKVDEANKTVEEGWDLYTQYRDEYYLALDAYDSALATYENGGPKPPPSLKIKKQDAMKAWIAKGHKNKIDSAVAVLAAYEALEPQSFWYKLNERYDNATQEKRDGSQFQPVGISPPYKAWFQDAGWTTFTFSQKDMDNQSTSQAIGVAGKLDGSFGIFNVSGSGDYSKDASYVKMDQTKLDFSCELMRISLDRSWMNPLVFGSRAWRWAKASPLYGAQLSSGADLSGGVAPTGSMTVLPTAAILSRNLTVKGDLDKTIVDKLRTEISAEASVGIGPFSISGRFNLVDTKETVKGSIATNGIEAKDVQIVALVCEIVPECPNPDNTLPWPE